MDKFLSKLIGHQSASLIIRPYEEHTSTYIEGELKIVVAGKQLTFTRRRETIDAVVAALENAYLCHDWSKTDPPVVLIAVHGGTAELVNDPKCVVIIANYDHLENNGCPVCSADLSETDREDRLCPKCGFVWTKEDE